MKLVEKTVSEGVWITHSKTLNSDSGTTRTPTDTVGTKASALPAMGPLTTSKKVAKYIKLMITERAPGPNGLSASAFKCATEAWSSVLASLFNHCYFNASVPDN